MNYPSAKCRLHVIINHTHYLPAQKSKMLQSVNGNHLDAPPEVMKSTLRFVLMLLWLLPYISEAQHRVVIKELDGDFKTFLKDKYVSAGPRLVPNKVVYLSVDARLFKGHFLEVENQKAITLFINGALVKEMPKGKTMFNLDSLSRIHSHSLSFSFFSSSAPSVSARIVAITSTPGVDLDLVARNKTYYLDFTILSCTVLLICCVFLYRGNPRLLADYFNFIKLLSTQEREENLLSTKIIASGNLLVYGVVSLFLSFLLMTMIYYTGSHDALTEVSKHHTVPHLLFSWIRLSFLLFALLLSKSLLVFSLSRLFNFNEAPTIQFFNFVRLTLMISVFIGLLLTIYFIFEVTKPGAYVWLFYGMSTVLILWMPLIFLKLLRRSPYSTFHLFSYLCASEIFPIVIVIKILFL